MIIIVVWYACTVYAYIIFSERDSTETELGYGSWLTLLSESENFCSIDGRALVCCRDKVSPEPSHQSLVSLLSFFLSPIIPHLFPLVSHSLHLSEYLGSLLLFFPVGFVVLALFSMDGFILQRMHTSSFPVATTHFLPFLSIYSLYMRTVLTVHIYPLESYQNGQREGPR